MYRHIDTRSGNATGDSRRTRENVKEPGKLQVVTEESGQSKQTILLIDDDELGTNARQQILEMQGYCVLVAPTAERGLHVLSTTDVDLLIVDYQLPDISGVDLLTR